MTDSLQDMVAVVKPTRCGCHPETCGHGELSLYFGAEFLTTGSSEKCKRIAELINRDRLSVLSASVVSDEMVGALYDELFCTGKHINSPVPIDPKAIIRNHMNAALSPGRSGEAS